MMPASAPMPPDLASAVNAAIARASALRLDVHWFPSVTSTMDIAAEAVEAGAAEGLVIVAEEQTAGRGRRGRMWSSPAGAGLYLALVLRPAAQTPLSLLTITAGLAVREAIVRATGLMPAVKWPNDIMVGRHKLAGILAEGFGVATPAQAVVIGMGVNILRGAHPLEVASRATSLEGELGRVIDRTIVFEEVLVSVSEYYDRLRRGEAGDILRAWRDASPSAAGSTVEWDDSAGTHRGVTAGIDAHGALLVRTPAGVESVMAGELRWL